MRPYVTMFILALALSSAAEAVPFGIDFRAHLLDVDGLLASRAAVGDPIDISVIVDNGGTSHKGQIWTYADTRRAVVRSGTYVAEFSDHFFPFGTGFATDLDGQLIGSAWFGTEDSLTSRDSFGHGSADPSLNPRLFANGVREFGGAISHFDPRVRTLANWSHVYPLSVPEPSALLLCLCAWPVLGRRLRRGIHCLESS